MNPQYLEQKDGHTIAYYDTGNPDGDVVLNFHGGPGSASKPHHAERYDPKKNRVILFDQRGCGRSTPLGEIENNNTETVLEDAERLRKHLGIEKWFVAGSSWGSTCALLYTLKHADRVRGMLLSSVFLADKQSYDWCMRTEHGAAVLMPDVWDKRMDFYKEMNVTVDNADKELLRMLLTEGKDLQSRVAAGVFNWEHNLFSPQSSISYIEPDDIEEKRIASSKVFLHFESNDSFIPNRYILDNASRLEEVPTIIVHGRYDILCPLKYPYELSKKLKSCELVVADSSGHSFNAEGKVLGYMAFKNFLDKNK